MIIVRHLEPMNERIELHTRHTADPCYYREMLAQIDGSVEQRVNEFIMYPWIQ